ncbi:MAG: hypothetical protein MUF57_00725 [Gammaproteobacteria bacterium]|jgi:hypothetical protein|nr:hypothetical protein [Gammaproteobacteria bacterium]
MSTWPSYPRTVAAALLAAAAAHSAAQPPAQLRGAGVITYQPGSGAVTVDGRTLRLSTGAEEALRQRLQAQGWRPGEPISAHFDERPAVTGGAVIDDIQPVEKP